MWGRLGGDGASIRNSFCSEYCCAVEASGSQALTHLLETVYMAEAPVAVYSMLAG